MSQQYRVDAPRRPGIATAAVVLAVPAAVALLASSVVFPIKTWTSFAGFGSGLSAIFAWVVVALAWFFTYVAVRGCWQYARGSGVRMLRVTFGWLVVGGGGFTVEAIEHPDPELTTWIVGIGLIIWGIAGEFLLSAAARRGWPPPANR